MKRSYRKGSNKSRRIPKLLFLIPGVFVIGGMYLAILILSPAMYTAVPATLNTEPGEADMKSKPRTDTLIIPKIGVNIQIVGGNDSRALEKGAWHRFSDRGNPKEGGNFILSAHRFVLGFTPSQTKQKSPFYNIHKLEPGDKLSVWYDGREYSYVIAKKYSVDRYATHIELPTNEDKLTLYSCDLKGEKAGREVIEAVRG